MKFSLPHTNHPQTMSDFYSLTKEQQAYLMQVAQTFPAKSVPQQRATIITSKEREHHEQQSCYENLPDDDDSESDQLYCTDEESEKDEDNDEDFQVSSLETS